MKLKEKIGSFLQLSDVPNNSIVVKSIYGIYPMFLLNKLYNTCIQEINGIRKDIDDDPLTVPYTATIDALRDFNVFNIVDDVEKAVVNNLNKGIKRPVPIHTGADEYIRRFSNTYLKFRREQRDCGYILTAFDSELHIFAESAELNIQIPYTSCTTFRSTSTNKTMFIASEAAALRQIKQLFNSVYDRLRSIIYELQKIVIKLRSTENSKSDIDLEL